MTGQKNRYSTQESLCGIGDKQFATPKHDELVLILLNKDYCKSKITTLANVNNAKFIIESEVPILTSNRFIIGYWDLVVTEVGWMPKAYIECEPYIESFGATLRQLNTYKEFLDRDGCDKVYLFTPDLRFKDAFESQNVKVISP